MKPSEGKAIVDNVKKRGYILINDMYHPPNSREAIEFLSRTSSNIRNNKKRSNVLKTGWIDDERNVKNKMTHSDMFDMLVKVETGLEVWNEFYFSTERAYRIDKAFPVYTDGRPLKIAVEINGGIWMEKSGHNTGTGIKRDQDKANLLLELGWRLISVDSVKTNPGKTIELIKKLMI